jgi:predicted outer membrane lipoprotein
MDIPEALGTGLIVGMMIATQFGVVSALLLETAVRAGPRAGAAAGAGVASVDMAYATGAVIAGGAARAGLGPSGGGEGRRRGGPRAGGHSRVVVSHAAPVA